MSQNSSFSARVHGQRAPVQVKPPQAHGGGGGSPWSAGRSSCSSSGAGPGCTPWRRRAGRSRCRYRYRYRRTSRICPERRGSSTAASPTRSPSSEASEEASWTVPAAAGAEPAPGRNQAPPLPPPPRRKIVRTKRFLKASAVANGSHVGSVRRRRHREGAGCYFLPLGCCMPPTGPLCCTCPGCAPASGRLLGHLGTGSRVPGPGGLWERRVLPECVCSLAVHGCCHGSPQHSVLRSRRGREPRCVHGPSEKGRARPKLRPPGSTNRFKYDIFESSSSIWSRFLSRFNRY